MKSNLRETVHAEVEMMQAFTRSYRAQLGELIVQLNQPIDNSSMVKPNWQLIRWCVEAVDMMLLSQAWFAEAIEELARQTPPRASKIA